VHEQYAAEARAAGIGVSPQAVRAAFKPGEYTLSSHLSGLVSLTYSV
jgi:hypothetical protein